MQSGSDFWVYLNIIRKRLWLIGLLFLVTVGVILAITYTAKPRYRATVRLQVMATYPSDVALFSTTRSSPRTWGRRGVATRGPNGPGTSWARGCGIYSDR